MSQVPCRLLDRSLLVLVPALVLTLLPSCFTVTAWGGTFGLEEDGEYELHLEGGQRWSDDTLVMVLLTPFTLALDVLTACPQAVLMGWRTRRCD